MTRYDNSPLCPTRALRLPRETTTPRTSADTRPKPIPTQSRPQTPTYKQEPFAQPTDQPTDDHPAPKPHNFPEIVLKCR